MVIGKRWLRSLAGQDSITSEQKGTPEHEGQDGQSEEEGSVINEKTETADLAEINEATVEPTTEGLSSAAESSSDQLEASAEESEATLKHSDSEYEEDEDDEEELADDSIPADNLSDDPLGEAFDLDQGEKLSRDEDSAELPWKTKINSARDFFQTEVLYRHDILEPEQKKQICGTYRLELKGNQGGIWSIEVGEEVKVENCRNEAETIISMQQSDFLRIANGELNPQLAILAKKVRVQGDIKKAVAFQSLIAPAAE